MRIALQLILAGLLCVSLGAQQSGDANRNYVVNGQGLFGTSPVQSTVVNCLACGIWDNVYGTSNPGAPVFWLAANGSQIGWAQTSVNSIDVGPAGLVALLNGADATNPAAPFLVTGADGVFRLTFSVPAILPGTSAYFAMGHLSPTSPDGFYISQTHHVSFDPTNNLGSEQYTPPTSAAASLNLGDDDSAQWAIGFGFPMYGTTYTAVHVTSNGILTFGASDVDFSESSAELTQGPPRIAGWWDDLNPTSGGVVAVDSGTDVTTFATTDYFRVRYHNVAEFGSNNVVRFSITLRRVTSAVTIYSTVFDYEAVTGDGLVGIGSGQIFLPPTPIPVDLSQVPYPGLLSSRSYYEQFDAANRPDVMGQRVSIFLTGSGHPASIN